MILTSVAFLVTLGFALFVLGNVVPGIPEGYTQAIAVLGAVIVLGVGAGVSVDGLSYKSGEVHSTNSTTNTTTIEYQYQAVGLPVKLPLGLLLMIFGALGIMMHADRLSEL